MIKCVVWDLDETLLAGVYLESPGQPPPPNPELAGLLAEFAGRGIVHAIASRNPPEAADYAQRITGHAFAAVACGWTAKSAAISSIMTDLGLTADALAFVDNDALERAEVSFSLPEVLVLAPQDVADAATWPLFRPPVVTDEARRRGELYATRRARQEEARAFGGSRDEFLRYCETTVTIGPAGRPDLPRLHELSVRTHQFSSAGQAVSEAAFAGLLESGSHRVVTARLSDRFSDDGLVGCCVIATALRATEGTVAGAWEVPALMMSCRAMGRGVIEALLAWLCRAAAESGADQVRLPCVINPRNVPLRIALTGAGFRVGEDDPAVLTRADIVPSGALSSGDTPNPDGPRPDGPEPPATVPTRGDTVPSGALSSGDTPNPDGPGPDGPEPPATVTYVRRLDQPLPELPAISVTDMASQVRQILAELTDDNEPLEAPLDTPLLRDGIGLDSLRGTMLLARVRGQFGVDVAAEDLNLDAMATIGSLAAFIARRRPG